MDKLRARNAFLARPIALGYCYADLVDGIARTLRRLRYSIAVYGAGADRHLAILKLGPLKRKFLPRHLTPRLGGHTPPGLAAVDTDLNMTNFGGTPTPAAHTDAALCQGRMVSWAGDQPFRRNLPNRHSLT